MTKIDITPRNCRYERIGYWEVYWGGKLWYKAYYNKGIGVGYFESDQQPFNGKPYSSKEFFII